MKVIFNADDFGFSKGVNLGILESYQCGPVRSTTMMAGMLGFEHGVMLAKANPGLKIGIHLTLSAGTSIGGIYKTITDSDGKFFPLTKVEHMAETGETDLDEVEAEFEAQIQKVLAAGITPDHFDSHHHTHNLPGITSVYLKLAKKYGVNVRNYNKDSITNGYEGVNTTDCFSSEFYGETATLDDLKRILSECGTGSLEIMSHPAFVDYSLYTISSYNIARAKELSILTCPEIFEYITQQGIELCSFSEI